MKNHRMLFPMRSLAAVVALFVLAVAGMRGQDSTSRLFPRYGIFGGIGYNMHDADFRALPGIPNCCPRFTTGTGFGPFGGALYEAPLSSWLLASFRIGYRSFSADLTDREPVYLIINGVGSEEEIEHRVEADVTGLTGEIGLGIRVAGNLFLNVGPSFAFLLSKTYSQEEELITSSGSGTFLDENGNDSRSQFRNRSAGDLPNAVSLLPLGRVGLGYEIPLGKKKSFLLVPEISYAYAFGNLVDGLTWRPNGLSVGIAIKYSPPPVPPKLIIYDTLIFRDTTTRLARVPAPRLQLVDRKSREDKIKGDTTFMRTTIQESYLLENPEPTISGSVMAVGVDENGIEEPVARVRVEEFLASTAHPLLAFIFFDEGSGVIPNRYVSLTPARAGTFRKEELFSSGTLDVNHNVLNIIGSRMKEHPTATLTLTGCNSDEGVEKGNTGLSQNRAEGIRDYFVNTWGIDPSRLKIETRNLPNVPSNLKSEDGKQENRRVEITSNEPVITEVFQAYDTTRVTNPPTLRFKTSAVATNGVASWNLKVSQGSTVLRTFSGTGTPPANIDWDLQGERRSIPRVGEPLDIVLELLDPDGRRVVPLAAIPTDVITVKDKAQRGAADYRIDRYSLVLFDYNSSNITAAHQRVIDLVTSNLKPTSEILVEGFTDRSGSEEGNKRLSTSRAESSAAALNRSDAKIVGVGEARLLYTNDLPEGRFLCRTVQITAKTPLR